MTIHVRNLSTNEQFTLDAAHRVIVVPLPTAEYGDLPHGETERYTDTSESVTAQSWASEWPKRHAWVRTDRVVEKQAWDKERERRVWVRCSLTLL